VKCGESRACTRRESRRYSSFFRLDGWRRLRLILSQTAAGSFSPVTSWIPHLSPDGVAPGGFS
jgi:hypothetical protein